jgi:hypothetical protein
MTIEYTPKRIVPPLDTRDDSQVLRLTHEWPLCACAECQKKRNDRSCTYTAHEMVDAWQQGFEKGAAFGRRVP